MRQAKFENETKKISHLKFHSEKSLKQHYELSGSGSQISRCQFFPLKTYKPGSFLREWGFVQGEVYFQMPLSALKLDEPQFFAPHDEDEGEDENEDEENGDGNK